MVEGGSASKQRFDMAGMNEVDGQFENGGDFAQAFETSQQQLLRQHKKSKQI